VRRIDDEKDIEIERRREGHPESVGIIAKGIGTSNFCSRSQSIVASGQR
jgi:hypothetical protein